MITLQAGLVEEWKWRTWVRQKAEARAAGDTVNFTAPPLVSPLSLDDCQVSVCTVGTFTPLLCQCSKYAVFGVAVSVLAALLGPQPGWGVAAAGAVPLLLQTHKSMLLDLMWLNVLRNSCAVPYLFGFRTWQGVSIFQCLTGDSPSPCNAGGLKDGQTDTKIFPMTK